MRAVTLLARIADSRKAWILLILGAVCVRLAWALIRQFEPLHSEMAQVAITLSQTGSIADAYRTGSGPTTHVGPLAPALPALVYTLLGPESPAAEAVLTVIAALIVALCGLVLNAAFREMGTPAPARGLALLLVCLLPLNIALEARDLRVREAGLAALGLAAILLAVIRLDRRGIMNWDPLILLMLACAALFLLSPAAALGAYAAIGILAFKRIRWTKWPRLALLGALFLMLLSLPWALRNERLFGEAIWSRGNFGLEFALGTHADAVRPPDPAEAFRDRIRTIHPFWSDDAYARMQQEGELGYADRLGRASWAWARENPLAALELWARHLKQFFLPPAWLWDPYGNVSERARIQAFVLRLVGFFAFAGIALHLWRKRTAYLLPAAALLATALPYMLVQPRLRYRYVVASLLVFLAADAAWRLARRLRRTLVARDAAAAPAAAVPEARQPAE